MTTLRQSTGFILRQQTLSPGFWKSNTLRTSPRLIRFSHRSGPFRWLHHTSRPCHESRSSTKWTSYFSDSIAPRLRQSRSHSHNSKPSPDVTPQLGSPAPNPGLKERLKLLFKQYGWLSVGVYFALSVLDMPLCFLAVRLAGPDRIGEIEHRVLSYLKDATEPLWKILEPVAGPVLDSGLHVYHRIKTGALETVGGTQWTTTHGETHEISDQQQGNASGTGSASIWTQLALAYGIHKTLLIFIRVPLAAAITPKVARTLRSWGWRVGSKSAS